jgi:tryptophanyl-tRNA synthetase
MTRDVASRFHAQMGETFVIPEAKVQEETKYIPGTDGDKMSKSKGNTINLFLPDKQLRKQIMGIETDSTPLEEPKNPDTCNVFALYKLLAEKDQLEQLRANYLAGNYGYGHAKQALFELIVQKFEKQRELYNYYMNHPEEIDSALKIGAQKASKFANEVLERVRTKLGY